ncbi:MAG TPA: hypothetical protein VK020_10410, partial [Microlunatus sp.]|nr:hypothetical protein [Microlunatus sp.]
MDVRFTTDPAGFLAETGPLLAADPVIASVVATTTERAARERAEGMPPPQRPCWWATVREGGEIVGVAMRTAPNPPYPLFLMPMPDQAARALATALHDRDEHPGGCNGALEAIRAFADETVRRWGGTAEAAQHTRLFECRDVIRPRAVPGLLRPAGIEDLELVVEWHEAFHLDAAEQADRDPQTEIKPDQDTLRRHTTAGKYWLFVD